MRKCNNCVKYTYKLDVVWKIIYILVFIYSKKAKSDNRLFYFYLTQFEIENITKVIIINTHIYILYI